MDDEEYEAKRCQLWWLCWSEGKKCVCVRVSECKTIYTLREVLTYELLIKLWMAPGTNQMMSNDDDDDAWTWITTVSEREREGMHLI